VQEVTSLGTVPWTDQEIRQKIPEFLETYQERPITRNEGGMSSTHMFATWFMLRQLRPACVIESGVWWGQGTWLIERAVPGADVYSIDINLSRRRYTSKDVTYFDQDFATIDWSFIEDRERAVVFFDDHQNGVERVKQSIDTGFVHLIFEDNYPARQGDCYSLKQAFQHAGFTFRPTVRGRTLKAAAHQYLTRMRLDRVAPNSNDASFLKDMLEVYYEFPPLFRKTTTRWGDDWDDERYPTSKPLYEGLEDESLRLFDDEARDYNWICYSKARY